MCKPPFLIPTMLLLIIWRVLQASTIAIPSQFVDIQDGLDQAQSGDTVLVASGIYSENLIWPNTASIVLISEQGPSQTIIDGDSAGSVISLLSAVVDSTTEIRGFTIRNGAAEQGGGFRCVGASPRILDNIIEECFAELDGAGLYCINSTAIIQNNLIRNNITGVQYQDPARDHTNGGGICLTGNSSGLAMINDNIITGNYSTDYGGGITSTRNALISGNQIIDNYSDWFGGGIYHLGATVTLRNNLIAGNTSLWGAGVTLQGGQLTIFKCEILNNIGDGLHIYYGSLNADSSTFAGNTRDGIGAGARGKSDSRSASITHCNIAGNGSYGIRSSNDWLTLDATLNWWGDSSGPGGAGPGSGDMVSRFVVFDPWLTELGISSEPSHEDLPDMPDILFQNPMTPGTLITVKGDGAAELTLLDATGRVVTTLCSGILTETLSIVWNASDVPEGMYFLLLTVDGKMTTERVVVIR